jgi:hypothetical protein
MPPIIPKPDIENFVALPRSGGRISAGRLAGAWGSTPVPKTHGRRVASTLLGTIAGASRL